MAGSTWVIIPVHNRRETTLRCLDHLQDTQDWDSLHVLVVDDGSTDGTSEAIREEYPSVELIEGDGTLWWGGAIRKGMKYAREQDPEVYVWLNDDVLPEPGGVDQLATKVQEIGDTVLAAMVHTETDHEYTTRHRKTRWGIEDMPYDTDQELQPCDVTAGKFTAFPAKVVDAIGMPDAHSFPHHYCDYDYTLQATEHGFDVAVYTGVTARDTAYETGTPRLSPTVTLEEVVKNTFDPTRNSTYSLRTLYYKCTRFIGPPNILGYSYFLYRFFRSIGAIIIKSILVLLKKDHQF